MLTWLVIAIMAAIGLVLLCTYVMKSSPARWDLYFTQHAAGSPVIWQTIARLSDPLLMVLYAFILAGILRCQGCFQSAIWVLGTLGITDGVGIWLKRLVRRSRPAAVRAHYSFPSGHVLGATVMALLLLSLYRTLWLRLLVIIIWLLIATSRLFLKAHYLSDILGAICLAICVFSLSRIMILLLLV